MKYAWPILVIAFLASMALIVFAASTFSHTEPADSLERQCIDEGYQNAVRGLYRHLYDTLITNPPLDDEQAKAHFKTGLEKARRAKQLALEALQ